VLCNRGAAGIDGTVSSAFGAAAHAAGPVVLLIGDVAFAHDIGGLLAARRLALGLTIVLLANEGGGIFDFLAVSRAQIGRELEAGPVANVGISPDGEPESAPDSDIYTRHVATPTGLDFARAAALYELCHERVDDVHRFRAALERALARAGSSVIEVPGCRTANVELHERVWDAVSGALSQPAAGAGPRA
jgi:2-succinyl-5-enolpyruvyl-6-hydroxy-3-cyclohexene-1-carboxylate synthase